MPTDLGMRSYSLSKAERELGLNSYMIFRHISTHNSHSLQPLKSSSSIIYASKLISSFLKSLKADIVMFNQGTSLMHMPRINLNLIDVPVYKCLGKRIIVTYQGCDIRLCEMCPVRKEITKYDKCKNVPVGMTYSAYDKTKMKIHKMWLKYADAILGITPDLCRVDGVVYSPHAKYLPTINTKRKRSIKNNEKKKYLIAHMFKKHHKGSEWIEKEVERLCSNYSNRVEYVRIGGLSWRACLETLSSCDILIDQVLLGWYGGISVEAALLGTLPLAYIDREILKYVPKDMSMNLPVLGLEDKEDLYSTLVNLIHDADLLTREAERCVTSAKRWHDARKVSREIIERYYLLNVKLI